MDRIAMAFLARRSTPAPRHEDGFTLMELLVVLAILALLAGFAGPRVMSYLSGAKTQSAKIQMESLGTAMDLFLLDMGRYPTAEEGVKVLVEAPPEDAARWRGPYLDKKTAIFDPWGEAYGYRRPGSDGEFEIFSLGADKAEGGDGEDADLVAAW
jgi:general secretion pathway protein G